MTDNGSDRFDVLAARLNQGMTQRELAAKCGVSLTVIQRLEGDGGAHPRTAKKVADYFGVQVTDLLPLEKAA
jgi:transcriptional regulator with XRE-family HTH domain